MTDSVQVTINLTDEGWVIEADVVQNTLLPLEIFLYENTGTDVLGKYYGVCNFEELGKYQVWAGATIAPFGNRFVRHSHAKITVPLSTDPDKVVQNILATTKALKKELTSKTSTTTVYPI
jgi:hypothetical protein